MYHLRKELSIEEKIIELDFESIDPEQINIDHELIKTSMFDNDKVKGLKHTINDLILKIEDTCEEIKLYNNLINEKVAKNADESGFTKNYDEKKLVDLSKSGIIKKKPNAISNFELKDEVNKNMNII
jgi:hypothetical protein